MTGISDINAPELQVFNERREAFLRHYYEPEEGLFIAESARVALRALDAGYKAESVLISSEQLDKASVGGEGKELLARTGDVPLYCGSEEVLAQITGYHLTRGVLCACRRKRLPRAEDVIKEAKHIAVLEKIGNPANVGSIFRNAAALHMDAVLLTEGSADPLYRRAIRVSMGCVFALPWTYVETDAVSFLKAHGFRTIALALTKDAMDVSRLKDEAAEKCALFLGTEDAGLSPETIANADLAARIPMAHGVDSLNVAAASAVAFYTLSLKDGGVNEKSKKSKKE